VIPLLSCGVTGPGSRRADPCIWHSCGTNLSRRQSATMVGAPTDQARVCLAAPLPASTTLTVASTRASHDGRHALMVPEPSAWEAEINGGRFGR
jgi:hypothetical protein